MAHDPIAAPIVTLAEVSAEGRRRAVVAHRERAPVDDRVRAYAQGRAGRCPLLLAALLACGCAPPIVYKHGISDQAPTGDTLRQLQEESAPYRAKGSGVVRGHVSVQTPAGPVAARAGSRVLLLPATDYAIARFAAFVVADDALPPAVRAAAVAQANVDAQGDFTLESLPPGSYLIASEMFWTTPDGVSCSVVPYARFDLAGGARMEVAVTRTTP